MIDLYWFINCHFQRIREILARDRQSVFKSISHMQLSFFSDCVITYQSRSIFPLLTVQVYFYCQSLFAYSFVQFKIWKPGYIIYNYENWLKLFMSIISNYQAIRLPSFGWVLVSHPLKHISSSLVRIVGNPTLLACKSAAYSKKYLHW